MSSTVATATVATIATLGLTGAIGIVAVVALILFLAQRELAFAAGPSLQRLGRYLAVAIAPLLVSFGAIVVSRLASLL